MSSPKARPDVVDPDERWLYRVGGISALLLGLGYLLIVALYIPVGAAPSGAEAKLTYFAGHAAAWWAILGLSIFTDFLFVPVAISLYMVLKGIDGNAMLVATACIGLFVVLDLATTWTNYASLIALSSRYAAATDDAQRTVLIAAASSPAAVVESSLLFVYNTLTLSVGILMIGFVMRRGIFSKGSAYLGIASGSLGIAAVAGSFFADSLRITIIVASVLTTVWVVLVGTKLYRLGR